MGLQEHLTEKISNVLLELGVSDEVIESFEAYMEGSLEEQEFFNCLPTIDMNSLQDAVVEQLVKTYKSLEKRKAEEYSARYVRILFEIGGKSAFIIIGRCYTGYYKVDFCRELLKYKVKPAFVIAYYARHIVSREDSLSITFINFFDGIYEKYESEFEEAFDSSNVREQMLIAAYEVYKKQGKKKEICNWLNELLGNPYLALTLFDEKLIDYDKERISKYIREDNLDLDELVEDLKSRKVDLNIDNWVLKFLMAISYTIVNQSEIAGRFLKFSITIAPERSFNCLNSYLTVIKYNKISKLVDKINVNRVLYTAWMARKTSSHNQGYGKDLKQELDSNKEEFIKAMKLCNGINKAYMISLLLKQDEGAEYINEVEDAFINKFSVFMDNLHIEKSVYEKFIYYLRGEYDFESVKDILEGLLGKTEPYIYYHDYAEILFWLKDASPMFERGMKTFIAIGNSDILGKIHDNFKGKDKNNLASFIEFLKSYGASINNYISLLGSYAARQTKFRMEAQNFITKLISEDEDNFIKAIKLCNVDIRTYFLEKIFKFNKEKNGKVLIEYLGDSSKVVREKVIEILTPCKECHEYVIPSLKAKKQVVRESAVRILLKSSNKKVIQALNVALEVEKTEKIKALLRKILNVESDLEETNEKLDILEYCKKALKGNNAAGLKWLECDSLPKVRFKDSDKFAEDEIIKYMFLCYSPYIEIALNSEAKKVSELLDTKDLAKLALEVLERWLSCGAESKKKWVLSFTAIYGEYDVISIFKKNIEEWPKNSRGAIASDAVKALALNGSSEALIIIDNISRKFKFKQVKNAASAALKFAAQQMGIDMEELSDRVVPDLSFDVKCERVFDYGDRKFIVTLTPELILEVQDESGKKFKSLPAPGKRDDEDKATAASLEFKNLKKKLKTVANIQAIRLEMALSSNRKWTKEAWVKLFARNPIMNQFAIGLVWGVYKENVLVDSFRYMEDGTFNTKDEDEYNIEDGALIGLIHPVELSKEDMELWKEQLENYEVKQPFEQLSREVFELSEKEKTMNTVERFGGTMLNGLSLLGKLTGFEWSRGSIQDGAGYYNFYKEDDKLQIGVELSFSGLSIGFENDEVTVYDLIFYKKGTVKRGSYIYDTIKEQHIIKPSEIPNRFFSEILYQINKAIASKIGINDKWKEEK
ncbi:DUF4132 domain-containing protein [Clostridium tagluense]|uniref:DUF4132 domain-containing protein n=1 Tax=Clostridium tagluense TaxID=360422 RepID=UPI001CF29D0C|nr:DUF4132 domain-containing protein [Clostridium tagluense]MCB2313379.1 DUF4132 domain-containing protein [Clostridium tagluense]MCB2318203.1 DUF4132 domain-containing protein [Clostridium tagluense]MCB2322971.1 DUF4132 domain-containing protein [Clostridium tagluense]MCB2327987.1 DUF4132 domain-containing protein [Clostridium tagluense]MCB2332673.1 DUF4132 domain-containing protein [Clostridium tagluense]